MISSPGHPEIETSTLMSWKCCKSCLDLSTAAGDQIASGFVSVRFVWVTDGDEQRNMHEANNHIVNDALQFSNDKHRIL